MDAIGRAYCVRDAAKSHFRKLQLFSRSNLLLIAFTKGILSGPQTSTGTRTRSARGRKRARAPGRGREIGFERRPRTETAIERGEGIAPKANILLNTNRGISPTTDSTRTRSTLWRTLEGERDRARDRVDRPSTPVALQGPGDRTLPRNGIRATRRER